MLSYRDLITETLLMQSYAILFFVSFVLCLVIILASGYGFSRRANLDLAAVQSAHTGFVPRVGGLAIFISMVALIPLLSFGFIPLSGVFELDVDELTWLILSAFPVFIIGLAEDLGYTMSPKARLAASVVSSFFALMVFKVWIYKLGLPGIDFLLMFSPFAIFFTIFAAVGVVNAFNLIDGLNGLSSYVTISVALSLSIIAFEAGNFQLPIFYALIIASVSGFMVLNFPLGKIFLGDGGAYVLGHLLVWSAILLTNGDTIGISPFSILLIFFWPVADTGLAIWRRWKMGNRPDRPDRLHFHQISMRLLQILFFGRDRKHIVNPLSTVLLTPFITAPQVLGVMYWDNFAATVWCTSGMALLFVTTYLTGIKVAKKFRNVNI